MRRRASGWLCWLGVCVAQAAWAEVGRAQTQTETAEDVIGDVLIAPSEGDMIPVFADPEGVAGPEVVEPPQSGGGEPSASWDDDHDFGMYAESGSLAHRYGYRVAHEERVPVGTQQWMCTYIEDETCVIEHIEYYGEHLPVFGVMLGISTASVALGATLDSGRGAASGVDRVRGTGVNLRVWTGISRFRFGFDLQGLGARYSGEAALSGRIEPGSRLHRRGGWTAGGPFLAYAMQFSEHVQLWIGGFLIGQSFQGGVRWGNRTYMNVSGSRWGYGPELMLRVTTTGYGGVALGVRSDLAGAPGISGVLAWSYEFPKPPGRRLVPR